MSFHNKPNYQIPELIEALKAHRLPHDTPSQLADSFRIGWMACRELAQADSGFDYKTAADFLSGKTVSDEALRKFVAASRGAHDARAALHAKMLSLQGELASREAEIALLKRSLLDAEAAFQPSPKAAPVTQQAGYAEVIECGNSYAKVKLKGEAFGSTKVGDIFYTAPQQEAQEPAFVDVSLRTAIAKAVYQQVRVEFDYKLGSWTALDADEQQRIVDSIRGLYTTPQPAPAPPPECGTEAEKRAFAFGWFKALESERMKADNKKKDTL